MSKDETMELMLLDERGQFVASLHPTVTSAPDFVKFENRHYRRTGKLRDSPEEWQYDRTHTVFITLWSNPEDRVLTPFMGVGSEVYSAVMLGRKGIGIELKPSYYRQAVLNVTAAAEDGGIERETLPLDFDTVVPKGGSNAT